MKCTQCDSSEIVKGIRVVDRGEKNYKNDFMLEVEMDPNALFLKEAYSVTATASVCRSCFNVMFTLDSNEAPEFLDAASMMKKHGDPKSHPRYVEFVGGDIYLKNLNQRDLVKNFVKWLRKNYPEE